MEDDCVYLYGLDDCVCVVEYDLWVLMFVVVGYGDCVDVIWCVFGWVF